MTYTENYGQSYLVAVSGTGVVMTLLFDKGLVVVTVGTRAGVAVLGAVVGDNVVVSRQPPNHPYLTHEVVGTSDVEDKKLVELAEFVVVSSKQPACVSFKVHLLAVTKYVPHHPGVLHVSVRVGDAVEVVLLLDVVPSVPLLSKYFQLKQSMHSSSGTHGGISS